MTRRKYDNVDLNLRITAFYNVFDNDPQKGFAKQQIIRNRLMHTMVLMNIRFLAAATRFFLMSPLYNYLVDFLKLFSKFSA